MRFLIFELGHARYALDVRQIVEVLPLVAVQPLPQMAPLIRGLFNYRGAPIPVIDLSQLMLGHPSRLRLSTRIVLVNYPDQTGHTHLLGLLAERATQIACHEPSEFVSSGITNAAVPYLGAVLTDAHGLLQWIEVKTVLPAAVRDLIFTQPVGAT